MSIILSLPKQTYSWRFNPSLLSDDTFIKYITSQLKDFLETNDNEEVSDTTLWETLKVVIRVISYESILKKEREASKVFFPPLKWRIKTQNLLKIITRLWNLNMNITVFWVVK